MPKINDPSKIRNWKSWVQKKLFLGDLEIILLKARLEQTEKAMERLVAQIGITSTPQARHQDRVFIDTVGLSIWMFFSHKVSNIYGHREDILDKEEDDKECNCETCVKSDGPNTENDDDEMENVCDIDYDYPDEYYANDNTEDDSL